MESVMTTAIDIGPAGILALVLGALLLGYGSQALGEGPVRHEWLVATAGALIGGLAGSELLNATPLIRPVWDGIAVVPALLGAMLMSGVASVGYRTVHNDLAARATSLRDRLPASLPVQRADGAPEPVR
jgi:hypothetical protein